MYWLSECLFCNNYVYRLKDTRVKCSVCHKKISIRKINKILFLMECYLSNKSTFEASKLLQISYISAKQYYHTFRMISAQICEENYIHVRDKICEYDEYYYLEVSKQKEKKAIFDAHNFLTFDYIGHIYTILMPSLQKYKQQFLQDNVEDAYIKEFYKFKRKHKIMKLSTHHNKIVDFWNYFEQHITLYKGITDEYFPYYLKEFEFKYNHSKENAYSLLIQNYFKEDT